MLPTKMIVQKMIFVLSGLLCKRIDILLVLAWIKAGVESFLSRSRATRCGVVDIHIFGFVGGTVGSLSFACFSHVLIECPLAVGDAVGSGCGFFGLLLLNLLVGLGLGDDVCQEFQVLHTSDCVGCEIVSTGQTGVREEDRYTPTSRYWMFLRGLRSDLTTLCDCSTRCCRNISVATVITKAALFEQLLMSSSCEMIFLTRATNDLLGI